MNFYTIFNLQLVLIASEAYYLKYPPFFAGLGTTPPPKIKPGIPWPARPEEYIGYRPQLVDRFKETTIIPNRPFFAGSGTTSPPRVSISSPQIVDRLKETTIIPNRPSTTTLPPWTSNFNNTTTYPQIVDTINKTTPNRPFFSGSGTTLPPKIKPQKPWKSNLLINYPDNSIFPKLWIK